MPTASAECEIESEGGIGEVSARRVLRYLQSGTGPRRSPSACSEILKKNSRLAELGGQEGDDGAWRRFPDDGRQGPGGSDTDGVLVGQQAEAVPERRLSSHNYIGHNYMGHNYIGIQRATT